MDGTYRDKFNPRTGFVGVLSSELARQCTISAAAFAFAAAAHGNQLYGDRPYVSHLADVADIVNNVLPDDVTDNDRLTLFIAAILHDVVEDTPVTIDLVEQYFGAEVADIVGRVTDPDLPTRAERKQAAYKMIRELPGARIVKLADRLANVRSGAKNYMYRAEHPAFIEGISPNMADPIERQLVSLIDLELLGA